MKKKLSTPLFIILCPVLFLTIGCKKNDSTPGPSTPVVIGQNYQGGIVAYILQPGDSGYNAKVQHGLIAAPSDQSTSIQWQNGYNITTFATGLAIGTGRSNTARIIARQLPGNYAASVCTALRLGGYDDWYLPSYDELNALNLNIGFAATGANNNIGNFSPFSYWSSSEVDDWNAFYEVLYNGQGFSNTKNIKYNVRAVRSF